MARRHFAHEVGVGVAMLRGSFSRVLRALVLLRGTKNVEFGYV